MVLLSRLLAPLVGLHGVEKKTQRRRRTSSNIFPRRAHPVPSRTSRFLRPIDYPRYLPSRLSTDSSERVGSLSLSLSLSLPSLIEKIVDLGHCTHRRPDATSPKRIINRPRRVLYVNSPSFSCPLTFRGFMARKKWKWTIDLLFFLLLVDVDGKRIW